MPGYFEGPLPGAEPSLGVLAFGAASGFEDSDFDEDSTFEGSDFEDSAFEASDPEVEAAAPSPFELPGPDFFA